jgi:uncharacterized repeat protein (TIGR03803 family)
MKNPVRFRLAPLLALLLMAALPLAWAQSPSFTAIHDFGGTDGGFPAGNLIADSIGNLYGTTAVGGLQNMTGCNPGSPDFQSYCGTVFKLTKTSGGWTTNVLHEFTGGSDGGNPSAGLLFDSAGNLYGTTTFGGNCAYAFGCGVVFELSPSSSGQWTETVLYSFQSGNDGGAPESQLVFDAAGNLFGTTLGGGSGSCGLGVPCGVIFELSPSSLGSWTEKVLYSFTDINDGAEPIGPLTIDSKGNLYGTTSIGGSTAANCGYPFFGCGTVFQLSPDSAGGWSKTTLYTFNGGIGGAYPIGGVIIDSSGTLYGAANAGGLRRWCGAFVPGCGVVFALKKNSSGTWHESILQTFQPGGSGGQRPQGGLTLGSSGTLYGTANKGILQGGANGSGVVFQLSRNSINSWTETVLSTFQSSQAAAPVSAPLLDASGNLFGTTLTGGVVSNTYCGGSCGVVYQIAP